VLYDENLALHPVLTKLFALDHILACTVHLLHINRYKNRVLWGTARARKAETFPPLPFGVCRMAGEGWTARILLENQRKGWQRRLS